MLPRYIYTRYSEASSQVNTWLDELRCTSSDTFLLTCSHSGIGNEDCTHAQDVAISCSYSSLTYCGGMLIDKFEAVPFHLNVKTNNSIRSHIV